MKENCWTDVQDFGVTKKEVGTWIVIRKRTWTDATVPTSLAPEKGFVANALPITWI